MTVRCSPPLADCLAIEAAVFDIARSLGVLIDTEAALALIGPVSPMDESPYFGLPIVVPYGP